MKPLLLLLTIASGVYADGSSYLELNKPHRLIGNKVRVRAAADLKAKTITELNIGSEIIPLDQSGIPLTLDGVEAPWFRVSFTQKGKRLEGYVWGNLIARSFRESKSGLLFLYGIGRGKKEVGGYEGYTSKIRVARDGKELAQLEIAEGVGSTSRAALKVMPSRGLTGVENIATIHFQEEYCAGKMNTLFVFWTGKKLVFAHSSFEGADAPVYATEKQIFPDEKGGKQDHILILREHGDHDDPKSKQNEKFWLKWDGAQLKKADL